MLSGCKRSRRCGRIKIQSKIHRKEKICQRDLGLWEQTQVFFTCEYEANEGLGSLSLRSTYSLSSNVHSSFKTVDGGVVVDSATKPLFSSAPVKVIFRATKHVLSSGTVRAPTWLAWVSRATWSPGSILGVDMPGLEPCLLSRYRSQPNDEELT